MDGIIKTEEKIKMYVVIRDIYISVASCTCIYVTCAKKKKKKKKKKKGNNTSAAKGGGARIVNPALRVTPDSFKRSRPPVPRYRCNVHWYSLLHLRSEIHV